MEMRIEHRFYSKSQEKMKRTEEKLMQRARGMTREKYAAELEKLRGEAAVIMELGERMGRKQLCVPDAGRIRKFRELTEKAVYFAEYMDCDILAESDLARRGRIVLCGGDLLFLKTAPGEILPIFLEMLNTAQRVWCRAQNDLIRIELEYMLTGEE